MNWYMDRLTLAALSDQQLSLAFLEVVHLMRPPAILFQPRTIARVLFARPPRSHAGAPGIRVREGTRPTSATAASSAAKRPDPSRTTTASAIGA